MLTTCKKCKCDLIPEKTWSAGMVKNRNYLCMACNAAKGKAHYHAHAERSAELQRKRLSDPEKQKHASEFKNAYYAKNKAKWAVYHKTARAKDRTSVSHRASRMLTWIRTRAARMGVTFDLTQEWIMDRLTAGHCEVTGIKFELHLPAGQRFHAWAPSVDRIDSKKGYTIDNCRVVVWIYNMAKSEWSDEIVETFALAMAGRMARSRAA
jgi:hypothetical protein